MHTFTDEELMERYQRGEVAAMDELLARYKDPLFRFAWRLSRNEAEAQDAAQEVFVRVHQHARQYKPGLKVRTWLFSICHHLCVSRMRKSWRMVLWPRHEDAEGNERQMDVPSDSPSPEDDASRNEMGGIVKQCLERIPFLQREALVLREYERLEYKEIAHILHKPEGTVKTLIYRARMALRKELLPYIEEAEGGAR